jgi:hypothetical protein
MIMRKVRRVLTQSLWLALVFTLVSQPMLVAAQTLRESDSDPISALTASGDAYITSVSQAALLGAELLAAVDGINAAPVGDLSEEALVQARGKALGMAEQAAIALGSVDDLADSIEAVSPSLPAPIDVGSAAADGLPDETASDLGNVAGLAPDQVEALGAELESLAEARLAIGASGLPSELEDQLRMAGFSDGEIAEVATALGARGLADGSLASSLAQFRATQDELAGVRTRALMLYVQLLGKQIAVRQVHGIAPRPVTDDELKALAQDELRLLIHIAHLDELWGGDPSLDVGEGDWWFVERYAAQAAERLEAVTLDSQNRGLVVELLLIHQMRTLAISARSGDADYVKAELDRLSGLLSLQLGDESFVARERQRTGGLVKLAARIVSLPFFRDKISWPVGYQASDLVVDTSRQRLDQLGVVDLTPLLGLIPELDETNNQMALLFAAGLPFFQQLEADILLAALDVLSVINDENVLVWIEAILTGNTDDPALMVASVLFSLLPVIGVIPDIVTLAVDASIFVKALSLLGIIGSLGDLIGLIPGLQGIGGASFLGDAASAVIKTLFKNADTAFRLVLDALRLEDAFDVVLDLVKTVIHFVGGSLGSARDEVIAFLRELFEGGLRFWDNFVAFVRRAGTGLLLELGFDEGSLLVGGILRRGGSFTDNALRAVDNIGDDVAEAGIRLSDEAADGVGDAVNALGEGKTRQVFSACLISASDIHSAKVASILPRPHYQGVCQDSLSLFDDLSEAAQRGFNRVPPDDAQRILLGSTAVRAQRIGDLLAKVPEGRTWTSEAVEGLVNLVDRNLDGAAARIFANYSDDVVEKSFVVLKKMTTTWDDDAVEGVARLIDITTGQDVNRVLQAIGYTGGKETGEKLFRRIKLAGDRNVEGWQTFARSITGSRGAVWGGYHTLDYAENIGFSNIREFERTITRDVPGVGTLTRKYDLVDTNGNLYELKNISEFRTRDADELARDLQMLSEDELSGMRWVFRGPEDESLIRRVINTVKEINADLYDNHVFDEDNLVFFGSGRPFD